MSKRWIFVLAAVGLLVAGVWTCSRSGASNQPITLRYVKNGAFDNRQMFRFGNVFWATNHTANTLAVYLFAIEIKTGTNWITQFRQGWPLHFEQPGTFQIQQWIGPHAAGYAMLPLPVQPAGTTWRVKVRVFPIRSGLSATAANIRYYPQLLQHRIQSGNTRIPLNPFSTKAILGKSTCVLSQEVTNE